MVLGKRSKDLTGQQFGSLTALKPTKVVNRMTYWEFKCVCGNTHEARGNTVVHQSKKIVGAEFPSCGCKELEQKTRHGFRKTTATHPAYRAYRGMMSRCYNPTDEGYKWYGGKGVEVCEEWKDNPKAFVEWAINNGWREGLHIDKDILCSSKDTHPHIYSPSTCQWVSPKTNVAYATNRKNYGSHPNIKLSQQEVDVIVEKHATGNYTYVALAKEYGVAPNTIKRVVLLAQDKR